MVFRKILDIQAQVISDRYGYSVAELKGHSRKRLLVLARHSLIYIMVEMHKTEASLKDIGNAVGGRDHATIIHAIGSIKDQIDTENKVHGRRILALELLDLKEECDMILNKLYSVEKKDCVLTV